MFIVDGQQRLTTLALMLIALHKMTKTYKSELHEWIEGKICGHAGNDKKFWMNHEKHIDALRGLFEGKKHQDIDISSDDYSEKHA